MHHAARRPAHSTALRVTAAAISVGLGLTLASCAGSSDQDAPTSRSTSPTGSDGKPAERAGEQITTQHEVLPLAQVSQHFFENSDTLVLSAPDLAAQAAAAQKAVELGAPMLVKAQDTQGTENELRAEFDRLGVQKIHTYGNVGEDWLSEYRAKAEEIPEEDEGEGGGVRKKGEDKDPAEPVASAMKKVAAQDTEQRIANPVLLTAEAGIGAAATARAAGAEVLVLPYPDPRATKEASELVRQEATIAIGEAFGNTEYFRGAVAMAGRGELPGGGELVFPGRRMIALYGHPSGPALGVMGSEAPEDAVAHAKKLVSQYQEFADEPVIPAFEIITTIASSEPGPQNHYTNYTAQEDLLPYIDAITEAGGYAILDLQPGRASFLDQAKAYEELLKRPNVGLALDPEWHFEDDEKPLDRVGSVEAHQVNEVSEWLAGLVRDNELPQKALVLHQFQLQMLRDREQIRTDHPELAMVLHADGHGTAQEKFETWNVMRRGLDPRFFMAWKNFYKEDKPLFTPEETFENVSPKPWFVSYQ